MMDPMALLDMERRTGTSNQELDDFINKADAVARAVAQIKEGTFDPETCDIPGYKTPQQEEAELLARMKREEERKRREDERKRQEKKEEHESWWKRANLRYAKFDDEDDDIKTEEAEEWANRIVKAYKSRDANDYSLWSKWEPKDPVTLEEKAQQEALLEKMRNEEFEKANPGFCNQFKEDLEKREKSTREKERQAEKNKKQGNHNYKRKQYALAISSYMNALHDAPFCPLILTNIAQSYLRLNQLDNALEFCNRALFVNPSHIKALSRKAAILHIQQNFAAAFEVIEHAVSIDTTRNQDLLEQHVQIKVDYDDERRDKILKEQLDGKQTLETWHLHTMNSLLEKLQDEAESNHHSELLSALLPMLEVDPDSKLLFRTTGALNRITARLIQYEDDAASSEKETILKCILAMVKGDSSTQHRLFLDTSFRAWMSSEVSNFEHAEPYLTDRYVLDILDECTQVKFWKTHITANTSMLGGLLRRVQFEPTSIYASSILFKASELDNGRHTLTTALVQPVLRSTLLAIESMQSSNALPHILGLLVNLTNHDIFREIVATEADVPTRMCQGLVSLLDQTCSDEILERLLAVLLNISHDPTSRIRQELSSADVHKVVLRHLQELRPQSNLTITGRLIGVLCRLHSLQSNEIASTEYLSALWKVFQVTKETPHIWGMHAQLFCHLAWSLREESANAFMEENHVILSMINLLKGKHKRIPKDEIPSFERAVTNSTKCMIGMLSSSTTLTSIQNNKGLDLLVDLMSNLKDGNGARKNVAVLLAKLCQRNEFIKEQVRGLRGIEMMLSICRDMKVM